MINHIQNGASWNDTLKARKEHLTVLLKIVDIRTGKTTTVQELTINLIKEEMSIIESKLKNDLDDKPSSCTTIHIDIFKIKLKKK